jgi:hypothetical protein
VSLNNDSHSVWSKLSLNSWNLPLLYKGTPI